MIKRIFQLGLVSFMLGSAAWAQQPRSIKVERDDFFREVLSRNPLPKTLYYDTTLPGSYQFQRMDAMRGLPELAKSQNIDLRGLLLIGPYGPTNVVFVYAFIAERSLIRVNELTMAQARFTYKSTGTLTRAQYDRFWNGLLKTNMLVSGTPDNESKYETLLARWSNGNVESYYGSSINPRQGANANEFGQLIGRLLQSLSKTYPLPLNTTTRPAR